MNKKGFIIGCLAFVILIAGASLLYSKLSQDNAPDTLITYEENEGELGNTEEVNEGETEVSEFLAPDFTVYDAKGNAVKLSDLRGKPVVLNFWASWCGPCQLEMPDFHEKYLELGEEIHFLMVNMTGGRETLESAKEFIAEKEYTFPVFFDMDTDAAAAYGVYSLPTTYFIDADGYAIAQATGAIDADTLQRGIDMIR